MTALDALSILIGLVIAFMLAPILILMTIEAAQAVLEVWADVIAVIRARFDGEGE